MLTELAAVLAEYRELTHRTAGVLRAAEAKLSSAEAGEPHKTLGDILWEEGLPEPPVLAPDTVPAVFVSADYINAVSGYRARILPGGTVLVVDEDGRKVPTKEHAHDLVMILRTELHGWERVW